VQQGLRAVVEWDTGTANDTVDVPGVMVSGKTGTAEFCDNYPQCLDRDGRVKTSHAWFTAYAPSFNPEIATVVFVYGGGEGSAVAIPVTNKILRHYFKIPDDETPEPVEETQAAPEMPENPAITAALLGADSWNSPTAGVSGFVLNQQGQGVPNISIQISANGQVAAQIITGPTGQFDYLNLDPAVAPVWQLTLPDYPDAPPLRLEVEAGFKYLAEFTARPAE
jgi:penicillin-binding protein 2